ncbi:MAG: pilus assembly protein PilM [Betaproteobacteria bacterium]|nr:pilus assembly protein PilM [Betaproteobacteria bacterium]
MQFNLFDIKTPSLVGVDISSTAVKLVELGRVGEGKYRLEGYVIEDLPKDAVVEGNLTKINEISEVFKQAWSRLGTRLQHVAMALPPASVISKKIVLPDNLPETEIEFQVQAEASEVVPFAMDEVNLDYQVLGPSAALDEHVDVLLVASRKEKIEDRVAVAEAAGLKVLVIDTEANASQTAYEGMLHLVPNGGRGKVVALIVIGAAMRVIVFVDNVQVYVRDLSFGGNNLTQEIQRHYALTFDVAEKLKRKADLPENYAVEVLQPFLETLIIQIDRALQTFLTSTSYVKVDDILLAGGTSVLPGLVEAVSAKTGVSTQRANPFDGMAISGKIALKKLEMDAPALLVACGLAMRSFDAP